MSVDFEEDNFNNNSFKSRSILGLPRTPKMIQFLIKKKIIKNEKSAGRLLLIITILCFVISSYLIFRVSQPEEVEYNLSPEVLKSLPEEIQLKIYESQKK